MPEFDHRPVYTMSYALARFVHRTLSTLPPFAGLAALDDDCHTRPEAVFVIL